MGYDNGEEQTQTSAKKTTKNRARTTMNKDTNFTRYLWIPPPQTMLTFINISTYINEKPHTKH